MGGQGHEFIDLAQFRAGPSAGALLRKQYAATIEKAAGDRQLAFVISTAEVDRDGDTINADGWELGNYLKNPVVLWAHRYSEPPIARSVQITPGGGRLRSVAEFTPEDLYPFGFMVYRLFSEGFLSAVSVGFSATEWSYNEGRGRGSMDFLRQELLEYSAVPVPANASALIEARSKGIDLAPLKAWAEQILDEGTEAEVGLTREVLTDAWMVGAENAPVVTLGANPAAAVSEPTETGAADQADEKEPADELTVKLTTDVAGFEAALARVLEQVEALTAKVEGLQETLKKTGSAEAAPEEIAAAEAEESKGLRPEDLVAVVREAVKAEMAMVRMQLTGRLPD